ncbi:acetyl-CoA carboxylase, carboxyltransferase subunit beta [Marinicellulosiphila megalodicopiae]|uniref:acetyl-CoA carboxylase, carboxyltransferase subunit beta n=1 Tax=Marinicellulosiphila megalodicopiae TaxID=2724896 RepID=UPI003BAE474C
MSSWLDRIVPSIIRKSSSNSSNIPEGLWKKCSSCSAVLYRPELEKNQDVCPKCQHHMVINARRRIDLFLDQEGRSEIAANLEPIDRLKFKDVIKYKERIAKAQKLTGEKDAMICFEGQIEGSSVVVASFDFTHQGGSMGAVVGEKFTRAATVALEKNIPFICFSTSGGARMQEGLFSLMQMAKTSAVIEKLKQQGTPYISVMVDPCYGGVSASLSLLGDINIAEPNARVGFAGPRVIEQTILAKLPEGFQRSEFLLEHGAIDMIVHRHDLTSTIARNIRKLTKQDAA